jgi:hypothetical protein
MLTHSYQTAVPSTGAVNEGRDSSLAHMFATPCAAAR